MTNEFIKYSFYILIMFGMFSTNACDRINEELLNVVIYIKVMYRYHFRNTVDKAQSECLI